MKWGWGRGIGSLSHKSQIGESFLKVAVSLKKGFGKLVFEGSPLEAGENFGSWNLKVGQVQQKALIGERLLDRIKVTLN